MYADKRWEVQVPAKTIEPKVDPLTLPALIAWLEQQSAEKEYCYLDHGMCLIGQYFKSLGYKDIEIYSDPFASLDGVKVLYPRNWNNPIAVKFPHTFGAALARARKAASP